MTEILKRTLAPQRCKIATENGLVAIETTSEGKVELAWFDKMAHENFFVEKEALEELLSAGNKNTATALELMADTDTLIDCELFQLDQSPLVLRLYQTGRRGRTLAFDRNDLNKLLEMIQHYLLEWKLATGAIPEAPVYEGPYFGL